MKKVLVIANNCFSKTNSNGRTLGNLFCTYDKTKLAQFYISGVEDGDFCDNYFNVSDSDVIKSIMPFLKKKKTSDNKSVSGVERKRNVKNMIIRNVIWNLGFWKSKEFKKWLDDFNPDCVLLQVGDCAFMIKLALWIAKKYKAEIFLYNSEAYYFKENNYFNDGHNFLYKLFIKNYRRTFDKLIKKTRRSVYLSDDLKNLYDSAFGNRESCVIYNSSQVFSAPTALNDIPVFSYLGNLDLGRAESLTEVANALNKINPSFRLNVYGNGKPENVELLKQNENIRFFGFINREQLDKTIAGSDFLFHVESFDPFYVEDTKYGFSGKIAESLSSGKVFALYCPANVSCFKYLHSNGAAIAADNVEDLKSEIKKCIENDDYRVNLIKKELELAKNNHDLIQNANEFVKVINR